MGSAKVLNLRVRPSQWANLCFEVGGVVESSGAQLGDAVTQFDFTTFYGKLGTTVLGNAARLQYDSAAIQTDPTVAASMLCALRAEPTKAVLDKAVASRENSYYGKYANQVAVIAQTRAFYSAANAGSKPQRLATLSTISQNQADLLYAAYFADGRLSVIKTTSSEIKSKTDSTGETCGITVTDGFTQSTSSGVQNSTSQAISDSIATDFSNGNVPGGSTNNVSDDLVFGVTSNSTLTSSSGSGFQGQKSVAISRTNSKGEARQLQAAVNTDYGYRVPNLESQAQNHRAQISLIDEQFGQFMSGQNLPYLETVFQNELTSIDLDVKRLQIAYLNTILMSPIDGIITGLYKNPGDCVTPGEAVLRVENNQTVYLVGTLIHRDVVKVGSSVTVSSALYSSTAGPATTISGTVVATRGHAGDDDRWEVVVKCNNLDGGGNAILPLHYHFDYDNTSVTIV